MAGKRKSPAIRMNAGESGREAIERFLLFKRADGVKIKSLESYSQHLWKRIKQSEITICYFGSSFALLPLISYIISQTGTGEKRTI